MGAPVEWRRGRRRRGRFAVVDKRVDAGAVESMDETKARHGHKRAAGDEWMELRRRPKRRSGAYVGDDDIQPAGRTAWGFGAEGAPCSLLDCCVGQDEEQSIDFHNFQSNVLRMSSSVVASSGGLVDVIPCSGRWSAAAESGWSTAPASEVLEHVGGGGCGEGLNRRVLTECRNSRSSAGGGVLSSAWYMALIPWPSMPAISFFFFFSGKCLFAKQSHLLTSLLQVRGSRSQTILPS